MSSQQSIQPGKTYEFTPGHDSARNPDAGRKALVLGQLGQDLWTIRWPNGMKSIATEAELTGPVEPARPGIDEPCLLCGGTKEVEVTRPNKDKPWLQEVVGKEPCPNCGGEGRR